MKEFKDLREELIAKRGEIYSYNMNMSVGELISMYDDDEINLEPAFQRLFRWSPEQESNFVESILLGYPIPSIFVLQRDDGVWDVIDGVQRLSTIFHFAGTLKDNKGRATTPLTLENVKILKKLGGKKYKDDDDPNNTVDASTRIDFKRASFPVMILKSNSDPNSKYELFKRLNTGGSHLSPQEIRNACILMYKDSIYNTLEDFTTKDIYKNLILLKEEKLAERKDLDVLTRFLAIRNFEKLECIKDNAKIDVFLDEFVEKILVNQNFNLENELSTFEKLLYFLSSNICEDYNFRAYDKEKGKFMWGFDEFVFEVVILGCTKYNDVNELDKNISFFVQQIKEIKKIGEYIKDNGLSNLKVMQKLKEADKYAKELFNLE